MSYTVAIVGRPNVGKSTFFNRMLELLEAGACTHPAIFEGLIFMITTIPC